MKKILHFLVGIGLVLSLHSCIKDYDFDKIKIADWNPEIAAPLVSSVLTMNDLIENSEGYFFEDPASGQVFMVYESDVSSGILDDYLILPDQSLNTEEEFILPPIIPGDSFVIAYGQEFQMDLPGGERLDSLQVNASFNLHIESDINHNGSIQVYLPFILCDGQELNFSLDHTYSGTLPIIIDHQIDLSGCTIRTFTNGTNYNILNPQYKLTLFGDNNPILSPYHINMGESLVNIDFQKAYGFLGSREEILSDTIEIDVFNSAIQGSVEIDSVILKLNVKNYFGLPVRIQPRELWGYTNLNFPYIFRVSDLPEYFNVNAPVIENIGEAALTKISIRSADIASVLNNSPTKFYYDFAAQLNYGGSSGSNFILDTSKVDMSVQVEVPLSGSISALVLEDTVGFDLEGIDELEQAGFRIFIENTFPLDVEFQGYLLDETGSVIDSLFNGFNLIIGSGPIGPAPDLRVVSPGLNTTDIVFSSDQIANLLRTKNLLLKGMLHSSNSQRVKVYGDSYLKVQIGANVRLNVSTDN